MNLWIPELYYGMIGTTITLIALGLTIAIIMPGIEQWDRRFFIAEFLVLVLYGVVCFLDMLIYGLPNMDLPLRVLWFSEFFLLVLPMPMFTFYLVHCCKEDWHHNSLVRATLAVWFIYLVLLGNAQFASWFYYMTPGNLYALGPRFLVGVAPFFVMITINLVGVIRRRSRMSVRYYHIFLAYLLPLTITFLIHSILDNLVVFWTGLALSTLALCINILLDQIDRYTHQQKVIANQRAHITILQMRPHFIYNTMTSIYYLCDMDPKKAKQVTLDFTTYLRKNFFAITSDTPIPFDEELEHTRAYLAVEQAQFEDALNVCFDTPHTQFRVPPLTLQPIVENAVKHGMDLETGPLHITIKTSRTNDASTIIVEDNGPGFDPALADDPHTTLANIRQRLELMCGGSMTIAPRTSRGTVVRICIPQR